MIDLLRPPVYEEETKTYQALILHVASLLLTIGAISMIIYSLIYPHTYPLYIYVAIFLFAWQGILTYLNYNNKTRLGAWIYLALGWLLLSIIVFMDGGISSPNYAFYFSYIIIAGVLIDWRAGIILGIISIITGFLFLQAKSNNLLPDPFIHGDQYSIFFTYCLIIVIIVSLQSIASYTVFRSLKSARSENERRKNTENMLKMQNEEFHALNEELSESYERMSEFNKELEKEKSRAEVADHLKSAFLANMSHEIRTPMNAIVGFSELMDGTEISDQKKKQYIGIINKKSRDLLTIIDDIFDISKLETNQVELFIESGNIITLMKQLLNEMKDENEFDEPREVEIRIGSLPDPENSIILGDFRRIKQILLNLLGNALKFTYKGCIEFGCSLNDEQSLLFYVKDSGIGIATEQQTIIFDRFRQVDENQLSKKYGGTGLGLSISKGLVELMEGRIWVESELGKGSKFYFSIPYIRGEAAILSEKKPLTAKYNWKGRKILVVEDDRFNMEYFKKALSHTMADLYLAKNGEEARKMFQEEAINLVLMDIRLPDTNGYELSREFLEEKPGLPIIAQTAYAGQADQQKALDAGCVYVITKPIQLSHLMELIDNYIG